MQAVFHSPEGWDEILDRYAKAAGARAGAAVRAQRRDPLDDDGCAVAGTSMTRT